MKSRPEDKRPLVEQDAVEDFCSCKSRCPDKIPHVEIPSPTSCLPIDILKKLRKEIRVANELLLDLALDDDRPPEETFLKVFSGLVSLHVEVEVDTGQIVGGKVHLAGFDFVVLLDHKVEIIVPYHVIRNVKPVGKFAEPDHEAALLAIDPCLRRDLTFCFGATVASSPELLQLFFEMRFTIYLLFLEAKTIELTLGEEIITGFVTDVNKETIVVKVEKDTKIISTEKITMIKVKNSEGNPDSVLS